MNFFKLRTVFASALLAVSFSANAGVILSNEGITGADHFENFDIGSAKSNLTGDFGDTGISFTTFGAGGISLITNGRTSCNFTNRGMTGNFLGMGLNAPCTPNASVKNSASLLFAQDVSELSWLGFNFANGRGDNGIVVEAFRDGKAVDDMQILFNQNNRFNDLYVVFSGAIFDELRFTETSAAQGYIGIDNLAWKNVSVDTPNGDVPEPGVAMLLGIGLMGLVVSRRKALMK